MTEKRRRGMSALNVSAEDVKRVKGMGFLNNKGTDNFNGRIITINGKITAAQQRCIAEAAEKFGCGEVAFTTRMTIEVPGIPYEKIEEFQKYIAKEGLVTGGTGAKVRPIVACKGTTCQYGLLDSFALAKEIHERFYEGYRQVVLPHKFKIAVGGCPNNCVKPDLNDLGIVGQLVPVFDISKCRACKKCQVETACPIKVAGLSDGLLKVDMDACNHCGRCRQKCPFGVTTEYANGYKVYIGGRWGKKIANGQPLSKIFTREEEVLDLVEKAILLFRDEGITGERFADTVNRLGFDYVENRLLNEELKKDEILIKQVKGGASC